MSQSRANLHCCGVHHNSESNGVTLVLKLPDKPIECYATGDNPDSVVLLILGSSYAQADQRHIANVIARGAGVSVVVPPFIGTSEKTAKRSREDYECTENAGRTRDAIIRFMRQAMQVQYIGVLQHHDELALDIPDAVECLVSITRASKDSRQLPKVHPVPTSWIELTAGLTEETVVIHDDFPQVRRRRIQVSEGDLTILEKEQEDAYRECMCDSLYWFKKYLHDWS